MSRCAVVAKRLDLEPLFGDELVERTLLTLWAAVDPEPSVPAGGRL
jgi:hypothetical protein